MAACPPRPVRAEVGKPGCGWWRRTWCGVSRPARRSYGATCTVGARCGASRRYGSSRTPARRWWPPARPGRRPAGLPCTRRPATTRTAPCARRRSTRWQPAGGSSRTRCGRRPTCCCGSRPRPGSASNAFFVPDNAGGRQLRNWYVNFEHPTRRTEDGFDTFDLTVDLVVAPDLTHWEWKDEDEYAHVSRSAVVVT
ncbi:DUF402 domain-containing protein [Streptomyces sp. NPDC058740]|uniref:DUF402 domain-containing protein n=1 Tax=Streptomyces sp. NPDC058740 TaxID=3346619 RepID=UPI0036B7CC21